MRPRPLVEAGVGRAGYPASDASQELEGGPRPEPPVEPEGALVEVRLEVLRRGTVVGAQEPSVQVAGRTVAARSSWTGACGASGTQSRGGAETALLLELDRGQTWWAVRHEKRRPEPRAARQLRPVHDRVCREAQLVAMIGAATEDLRAGRMSIGWLDVARDRASPAVGEAAREEVVAASVAIGERPGSVRGGRGLGVMMRPPATLGLRPKGKRTDTALASL